VGISLYILLAKFHRHRFSFFLWLYASLLTSHEAVEPMCTSLHSVRNRRASSVGTARYVVNTFAARHTRLRWSRGSAAGAVGFLGRKNRQQAFLRRGSKAVGPMS